MTTRKVSSQATYASYHLWISGSHQEYGALVFYPCECFNNYIDRQKHFHTITYRQKCQKVEGRSCSLLLILREIIGIRKYMNIGNLYPKSIQPFDVLDQTPLPLGTFRLDGTMRSAKVFELVESSPKY